MMDLQKDINFNLRSLLISAPQQQLTIDELFRDYIRVVGSPVPLKELGFRSLHDYLRSIPNDVTLDNPESPYAIVRAIVSSKTNHVAKLVREQKKNKNPSKRVPRRFSRRSNHSYVPLELVQNISKYLISFPDGIHMDDFEHVVQKLQNELELDCDFDAVLKKICNFTIIDNDYICLSKYFQKKFPEPIKKFGNELAIASSSDLSDDCSYDDFASEESNSIDENLSTVLKKSDFPLRNGSTSSTSNYSANSDRDTCEVRPYGGNSDFTRDDTYRSKSRNESEINLVSENLIKNLYVLLDENPNGMWLAELARKYESKYGYSLNPQQHGFDCVLDLATHLKNVFYIQHFEKSGDRRLLDARKHNLEPENEEGELPKSVVNDIKKMMLKRIKPQLYTDELAAEYKKFYKKTLDPKEFGFKSMEFLLRSLLDNESSTFCCKPIKDRVTMYLRNENYDTNVSVFSDDALPDVTFDFFPRGVCDFDFKLPFNPILEKICPGSRIKVKIAEAYTPERFYLHFRENLEELDRMMDDLHIFYQNNDEDLEVYHETVRRGLYCACIFPSDSRWHRVQVITSRGATNAKVRYIDYGTTMEVAYSKLRYLHLDFAKLPAMSVRVKLNGIKPKASSDTKGVPKYSLFDNESFFKMANVDDLEAEIVNVDLNNQVLDVYLFVKNGDFETAIHEELISQGLVERKQIDDCVQIPILIAPKPNINNFPTCLPKTSMFAPTAEAVNKIPQKNRPPPGIPLPDFSNRNSSALNYGHTKMNPTIPPFYPATYSQPQPTPLSYISPLPQLIQSRPQYPMYSTFNSYTPNYTFDFFARPQQPFFISPHSVPKPPPGLNVKPMPQPNQLNFNYLSNMQNGFSQFPVPNLNFTGPKQNGNFRHLPNKIVNTKISPKLEEDKLKTTCCCNAHQTNDQDSSKINMRISDDVKCENDSEVPKPNWVTKMEHLQKWMLENQNAKEQTPNADCVEENTEFCEKELESIKCNGTSSPKLSYESRSDDQDSNCDKNVKIEILKEYVRIKNKTLNINYDLE